MSRAKQKSVKESLYWTTRLPTETGWYWIRLPNEYESIVEVEVNCNGDLFFDFARNQYYRYAIKDLRGYWFAGPIESPLPPKFPA